MDFLVYTIESTNIKGISPLKNSSHEPKKQQPMPQCNIPNHLGSSWDGEALENFTFSSSNHQ